MALLLIVLDKLGITMREFLTRRYIRKIYICKDAILQRKSQARETPLFFLRLRELERNPDLSL